MHVLTETARALDPRSRNSYLKALLIMGVTVLNMPVSHAQQSEAQLPEDPVQLPEVVVSASRSEQRRFDAPASINAVPVDPFRAATPLVNMSELLLAVPGIQARERQNYAQDLQISVRGFGTRSTFGVRGVRILVDGIPATMPDGQGQAATASLTSASRIEILRGPVAQLYGNAAGGVVQVFTADPSTAPRAMIGGGAGSDNQRQFGAQISGGSKALAGLLDVSHYSTDGYRDHSAARRTHLNAKLLSHLNDGSKITVLYNDFRQPDAQDPLGLSRADFERNPRQAVPQATQFDTRKKTEQQQAGVVLDQSLSASDSLHARLYGGQRQINQKLAFSGSGPRSSGGIVDLDRKYGGIGIRWQHNTRVNNMPLTWSLGAEADRMEERRRGFVNNNGQTGELRRDEDDSASNVDLFAQAEWAFAPEWRLTAGLRASRVWFTVEDHYINPNNPDDSGSVRFRNVSPVAGLIWHVSEQVNIYANIGEGFETPTLAESAYRPGSSGPNFSLRPSVSRQAELGTKIRSGRHMMEFALFSARSRDEIVPHSSSGGRTIFQNAGRAERRGAEVFWQAGLGSLNSRIGYTWLQAEFVDSFNSRAGTVAKGNRLPGVPRHSLSAELQYRFTPAFTTGLEMRADSKVYVNDVNSEAAPGYAAVNLRGSYEIPAGSARLLLFGRVDNLLDRNYAGSVIVNETNDRFYEPAAGRRFFLGLRSLF